MTLFNSDKQIEISLRFGMANYIKIYLRLTNFQPQINMIGFTKPNRSLKYILGYQKQISKDFL